VLLPVNSDDVYSAILFNGGLERRRRHASRV
jgi:hypothetical protein